MDFLELALPKSLILIVVIISIFIVIIRRLIGIVKRKFNEDKGITKIGYHNGNGGNCRTVRVYTVIEKLNEAEAHSIKPQEKIQSNELELPINEHEKKRIFAYLIKERNIDAKLVQELVDKKLLYQGSVKYKDKDGNEQYAKGNAVFVQKDKDGNVVGAEIHGTNTYKRFKAIAGSGDENVFSYAIGTPKKVYAFESAIDLLSFKMLANPEKIKDSLLVSMGGLKPKVLKGFEAQGLKIISCVDNDERGKKFNEANNFQSGVRKLSEENVKDWNELLKKRVEELSTAYNLSKNNSVKKPEKHSFNKPQLKK